MKRMVVAVIGCMLWTVSATQVVAQGSGASRMSVSDPFPIKVDYDRTLDEMFKAGKYKPNITADDLPQSIKGKGIVEAEIVLLDFHRPVTSKYVKKEIETLGLEPAKIEYCLAFGAQHPDVQRKHSIIFLGAAWIENGRVRIFPCLLESDGDRYIALISEAGEDIDHEGYRFAAVRKKK